MITTAIMQPYLFPYIGYWQLINAADKFVVLDDVNYINKGWINRNNMLLNGEKHMFTLSLKEASQNKLINEIDVFDDGKNKQKVLKNFEFAYKKAPYFEKVFPVLTEIMLNPENNVAKYLTFSIKKICQYIDIKTEILVSSSTPKNNELKAQAKIMEICKKLNTTNYINPIGGMEIYDAKYFNDNNIELRFVKTIFDKISYNQFDFEYVQGLSIIDVMMFNPPNKIQQFLAAFELVENA